MTATETVRIVCVDDNALVMQALAARLRAEPWAVLAGSLSSADLLTDLAARVRPHVVLIDVDMPGKDAFEAIAELVEHRPDARVIVLSGHWRSELVDRTLAAGGWGYICKTAGMDAVIHAVRRVLDDEFVLGPDHPPA